MITAINLLIAAGESVQLVNARGARLCVTGTFFGVGVYADGRFISIVTIEVDGFHLVK